MRRDTRKNALYPRQYIIPYLFPKFYPDILFF